MIATGFEELRACEHPVRVVVHRGVPEPEREPIEHLLHFLRGDSTDQHRPHEVVHELWVDASTHVGDPDEIRGMPANGVDIVTQRRDVKPEPVPPHALAIRRRRDRFEDRFRSVDFTGFEREPGRVRAVPEHRFASGGVALSAERFVHLGERGTEVALPLGKVGETVPVAAGEEIESGSFGRVSHPHEE